MRYKKYLNKLNKVCSFFVDLHLRSGEMVSLYYINDYFNDVDIQSLRKRINSFYDNVHAINIIECNALVLHNVLRIDSDLACKKQLSLFE
ncbi:MAG: hypothetical protein FWH53_00485 [Leptospirales bacterium]|nr:hypothetical protein [Leptospirales bacterium]